MDLDIWIIGINPVTNVEIAVVIYFQRKWIACHDHGCLLVEPNIETDAIESIATQDMARSLLIGNYEEFDR